MQNNLNSIVNVPYLTIPLLSSLPLFSSPPLSFAELPIPALSAPWAPLCNKVIYYGVFSSGRVWLDLLIRSVKVEKILKDSLDSIELKNNKLHGLWPPGGSVSPPGGFASRFFDQGVS